MWQLRATAVTCRSFTLFHTCPASRRSFEQPALRCRVILPRNINPLPAIISPQQPLPFVSSEARTSRQRCVHSKTLSARTRACCTSLILVKAPSLLPYSLSHLRPLPSPYTPFCILHQYRQTVTHTSQPHNPSQLRRRPETPAVERAIWQDAIRCEGGA